MRVLEMSMLACILLVGCENRANPVRIQETSRPESAATNVVTSADATKETALSTEVANGNSQQSTNDLAIPERVLAAAKSSNTPIWLRVPENGKVFAIGVPGVT